MCTKIHDIVNGSVYYALICHIYRYSYNACYVPTLWKVRSCSDEPQPCQSGDELAARTPLLG